MLGILSPMHIGFVKNYKLRTYYSDPDGLIFHSVIVPNLIKMQKYDPQVKDSAKVFSSHKLYQHQQQKMYLNESGPCKNSQN